MSTGCTLVRVHDHDYTSAPEYSRVPLHGYMSTGCTLVRVHDHDYTSTPEYIVEYLCMGI